MKPMRIVGVGSQPCRAASTCHRLRMITDEMILVRIRIARPHPIASDSTVIEKMGSISSQNVESEETQKQLDAQLINFMQDRPKRKQAKN